MRLPTGGESREADAIGEGRGEELRRDASLLIRCLDCDGALLAFVAWVDGKPWAAAKEQGDRVTPDRDTRRGWVYRWADRSGGFLDARVGAYRHVLYTSDVREYLRRGRRTMKVRHTGPDGVSRP